MIKKTVKYLLYFLILITIGVFYLSYYGIETKRFNQIIKDKISENNNKPPGLTVLYKSIK